MEILQDCTLYLGLISLLVALYFVHKYKTSFYKYFVFYLLFALSAEFIGDLIEDVNGNIWFFNLYTFFEFLWVATIYFSLNKEKSSKKIIKYTSIVFYIIYFLSFQFTILQNYTVILLALFVTFFMFIHLKELLNSNKIINFKKEISFWITVGFLIYYLGTIPFFSLLYIGKMYDRILFTILSVIVIAMHLVLIGGLIWSKRIQKSSS